MTPTFLSWLDNLPIKFKDYRTYDAHATFGVATDLRKTFNFDTLGTRPNQNADGLYEACTSYAQSDVASNEDSILYDDYEWLYRKTLLMMGDKPFGQGCDMMIALKATTVYGVKSKTMTEADALNHRRGPYFIIRPMPDYFDGLLSAMLIKPGCVSAATPWFPIFEMADDRGIVPSPANWQDLSNVGRHDWEATGSVFINGVQYITTKSWQGPNFGDHGINLFNREQINALLSTPGAGAFVQKHVAPEDIATVQMTLWETAISYAKIILDRWTTKKTADALRASIIPVINQSMQTPTHPVQPATPVPAKTYQFDDFSDARHTVRVICDEEGLTGTHLLDPVHSDKDILCACIQQESNFNPRAINYNKKDGKVVSTDYGLCQINDYYHIGPGKEFESSDQVMNFPELSVRYMIKELKAGHLDYWVSYSSGAYKKFL